MNNLKQYLTNCVLTKILGAIVVTFADKGRRDGQFFVIRSSRGSYMYFVISLKNPISEMSTLIPSATIRDVFGR